jgi:Tfp pilus assembly major pilin PilA
MKVSLKRQQGLTFISLVFILGLIAFFVLLGLKIGPIYLDHSKVVSALSEIEKTPDIEEQSEAEIRNSLSKRFNINYVNDVTQDDITVTACSPSSTSSYAHVNDVTQDDITVTHHGDYLKVAIKYEVVRNIVGNLNVLVEFNDVIEVDKK